MKAITNWRYYAMAALFATGALVTLCAFADDATLTGALAFFAIGAAAFLILARLVRQWEAEGKIPEYTNLYKA